MSMKDDQRVKARRLPGLLHLIEHAKKAASARGHALKRFKRDRQNRGAKAQCSRCERYISVDAMGGGISGEAATYACQNEHRVHTVPMLPGGNRRFAAANAREDRWRTRATDPCTVYDANGEMVAAFLFASDAEIGARAPLQAAALSDGIGALQSLLEQIDQMKRMFDDDDGTIEEAIEDGEDAVKTMREALGRTPPTANANGEAELLAQITDIEWTGADDVAAEREGWLLLNCGPGRALEIDKDNDSDAFATGDDALTHVTKLAEAGSDLHKRALAIHRRFVPETAAETDKDEADAKAEREEREAKAGK